MTCFFVAAPLRPKLVFFESPAQAERCFMCKHHRAADKNLRAFPATQGRALAARNRGADFTPDMFRGHGFPA